MANFEKIPILEPKKGEQQSSGTEPILESETETELPELEIPLEYTRKTSEEIERDRVKIDESRKTVERDKNIKERKERIKTAEEEIKGKMPSQSEIANLEGDKIIAREEEEKEKQYSLKRLLKKEQDLRDIILDIEGRKKRKEDVSDMKEEEYRGQYKEVALAIEKSANEIAGKDVGKKAREKAERYHASKNQRRGETVEEMNQRLIEEKAEDKDYQARCVNRVIVNRDDLSEEQKTALISGREVRLGKNSFNKEEVAGLMAAGLGKEGIEAIKWPVFSIAFKIKLPNGVAVSEKGLQEYINAKLGDNFKEQAKKDIEAEKRRTANSFAYKMYQNLAETGNMEGEKESEEEKPKPEKTKPEKQEVSKETKELIDAKLEEEIKRIATDFYDKYIKEGARVKRKGEIRNIKKESDVLNVSEDKKAEFIIKNIKKINTEKQPEADKLKKELKGLMALRGELKKEEPSPEANYLALDFFYKKTEELSYFKEEPQKLEEYEKWKGEEQKKDWKDYSKITRELANSVAGGNNLEEESRNELIKFLIKPEIKKQFREEQEKRLKNITDLKQREFIKKKFKKQFEIRALRTIEEQKIKELLKKRNFERIVLS